MQRSCLYINYACRCSHLGQTGNRIGSQWVIYVLNTYDVIGYQVHHTITGGTVGAHQAGDAGGGARDTDAVTNSTHEIDQIYTATLRIKILVFNVWLPVGHFMH